jgi:hypothetical protein
VELHLEDLEIISRAFANGQAIPSRFAADGDGVSPPLEWRHGPDGTAELLLIVHDPDAPLTDGFTHGLVGGIDPTSSGVADRLDDHVLEQARTVGTCQMPAS